MESGTDFVWKNSSVNQMFYITVNSENNVPVGVSK